jgi:polysaccharide biosynthesis/export protein
VYSPAAPAPVAVQPQVVEKQVAKSDTAVAAAPAGDKAVATTNSAKPEATQSPAYSASPFASVPLAESTPTGDITNTNVIPSEPAPVVPAPSRGDAYAAAGLKQPNLSPQYSAPAPAVAVPAKTVATTVTTQPVASSAAGDSSTPVRGQFAITKSTTDYPVTSVTEPSPAATSPTPAPQACATCSLPYGCAYGPGQSGAPNICGVNCGACGAPCSATWCDAKCIPWSLFGPGEYVGPPRTEHVSTYYLRVNDLIRLTYITSHNKVTEQYRIRVGDKMRIEWLRLESGKDAPLDRDMLVQPDGTVTLPLVGQVAASGKTIEAFRDDVVKLFSHYQKDPQITITPIEVNTDLQDIVRAVTSVSGSNGQSQDFRVTPEGTIQASGLGSVYVQGLTLDELKSELEARYAAAFGPGLIVSPSLTEHATSFVFVGGEVAKPGRFTLEGPTTVMQAITMAGSWNVGGNTRQVVVFRRDENWCLKATKINLHAPLYGQDPCPVNDVWLRDNDLVIVPKERILCADDVINLYFTRGAYSVFPITFVKDFSTGTAIAPIP